MAVLGLCLESMSEICWLWMLGLGLGEKGQRKYIYITRPYKASLCFTSNWSPDIQKTSASYCTNAIIRIWLRLRSLLLGVSGLDVEPIAGSYNVKLWCLQGRLWCKPCWLHSSTQELWDVDMWFDWRKKMVQPALQWIATRQLDVCAHTAAHSLTYGM